jgi:glycine/D-amino acid oxidase-like deaminating enzyme
MVDGTAFRTTAAPGLTDGALGMPGVCLRRRADGGFTAALSRVGRVGLTPNGLRHARQFWPMFRQRRGKIKLRLGRDFFEELAAGSSWSLDAPSPFERRRVLDLPPDMALVARGLAALRAAHPSMARVECAEAWGGRIDTTPDAEPVISAVDRLSGFFLATGFSGHGFGIGPGAGLLAADLVSGDPPVVDPHPYRYSRFFDGTRLAPTGAL